MDHLGIYIHIPFCERKCAYCDFYSVTDTGMTASYAHALIRQIKSAGPAAKNTLVDTVYIGGGTPSLLDGEAVRQILSAVRTTFRVSDDAEITMECNPGTLDATKLSVYREAGVNRLSIGLQSADNEELQLLSRIHTREEFESSFLFARMEGFDNINVDIMYALPGQTYELLMATLDYVITMAPEHISFYGLKIEPNTPFGRTPTIEAALPDENEQVRMYLDAAKRLEEAGYMQYEISNFAKVGYECRHNLKYWKCEEYLGFGPAAYSFYDGRIYSYEKNVDRYIIMDGRSDRILDENERLSRMALATQYVMLGFRLKSGVDTAEYEARFGDDFEARYLVRMQPFLEKNYILETQHGYRLSRRGMLISNYILSEILDF